MSDKYYVLFADSDGDIAITQQEAENGAAAAKAILNDWDSRTLIGVSHTSVSDGDSFAYLYPLVDGPHLGDDFLTWPTQT